MNVLLIVPDGVGVRNFVLGSFLDQLRAEHHVDVLHVVPDDLLPMYDAGPDSGVRWHPLRAHAETAPCFVLRYALAYAQMYWANTRSMRFNLRPAVKGSWRTRGAHRVARAVGRLAASPSGIRVLDRCYVAAASRLTEVDHYRRLFETLQADVLLCSHQRPPSVVPAVLAARALGIPTATFIFSWDNLTSKGRIAAPFDHYLVWSELMRSELLQYYPELTAARVHIVGTPQFDCYGDSALLWSRREFFTRIGGDERRPLICYSGGDTGNSPEDPDHVRILLTLIRTGRIRGNPQVLVRPTPTDDGTRFDEVRRQFPELLFAPPRWVPSAVRNWAFVFPQPDDVQFLANLTYHADLNVNLSSTMTLDFALRDKPVVNVAFDVVNPPPFGLPLWEHHYRFEHYQPVITLGAARFARSTDELAEHVDAYLAAPSLDREGRQRLVSLQVGQPVGASGRKIVQTLEMLASGGVIVTATSGRVAPSVS